MEDYIEFEKFMQQLTSFQYFIITSKTDFRTDSLFNRFDRNIIDSVSFLDTISKLPVNLNELKEGWPLSATISDNDANYQIKYINENGITPELFDYLFSLLFGAIFVSDNVKIETITMINERSRLPIVSNNKIDGVILNDNKVLENLFLAWECSTKDLFIRFGKADSYKKFFKHTNLTKIHGYNMPSTFFLMPIQRTINRIRGLYKNVDEGAIFQEPTTPEIFDLRESQADTEIVNGLKRILVEKFLALFLGFFSEGSFNEEDEKKLEPFGIRKKEISLLIEEKDSKIYNELTSKILSKFENLNFHTDMVLCFPSINYHLLMKINSLAGKNKLPKKVLRILYNSKFYYYAFDSIIFDASTDNRKALNINTLKLSMSERAQEMALLSFLFTNYALGRRIPFIRTRNIPSQNFYMGSYALSKFSEKMEERNKVTDFVTTFSRLASILKEIVPKEQWDIILKHGDHLKILSDMPVEWANINGLPLCIEKKYSRVPITPGNGLISHSYIHSNEHVISKRSLKVLILNTLKKDEKLYHIGANLPKEIDTYLKLIQKRSVYREVSNKLDFFSTITSVKPSILIYYGHGAYDTKSDIGKLYIGDDVINSIELENIGHSPLITILGACETQVLHGTHLNTASILLGNLSVSVLGTFFPVDGLKTATFICSLMRNLVNTLIGVAPSNFYEKWDDVILQTYRSHYLLEPIHAMQKYLSKRKLSLSTYIKNPLTDFFNFAQNHEINDFIEILRRRNSIYQEIFSVHIDLDKAFKSILKNNLIIQDSLFYSSLGSPEKIKIDRDEETSYTIQTLNEYYKNHFNL